MGARSTTILANWLSWKVENSPFSSTLHLWHFPSLVRQVTTVLCLQQIRQSRIQSQAWRDSLNHLEERQGWSPPPPFPCPFPCGSSFPKFSWLHARGGREVGAFATQDGEQRNHPIPIPRPIMSQRRAVLTHALGDFCSLIPFRLLVVDDVVARIVLLPCVLRLPFLSSSSLFSLLSFSPPLSMASLATTTEP